MRLWVWRNIRIKLPDDWEMLSFSRKSSAGSCAFADRYRYRAELSWKEFDCGPGVRPDVKRLMSDYCAKLKLEDQMPDARPCRVDSWRGLVGHIKGRTRSVGASTGVAELRQGILAPPSEPGKTLTTRFGGYYSGESCLVELVFTWPDGRDFALEKGILKSVKEERPVEPPVEQPVEQPVEPGRLLSQAVPGSRAGQVAPDPSTLPTARLSSPKSGNGHRRWKAFGMDVLASDGLQLQQCKVEPASATMVFSPARNQERPARNGPALQERPGPSGVREERFQRLGMVPHWMRISVGEWLRRSVPRDLHEAVYASEVVAGHKIEAVRALMPATGFARLGDIFWGRRNLLEAAAWICPVDGRLYFSRIDARALFTPERGAGSRAPRVEDPSAAQERQGSTPGTAWPARGEGREQGSLGLAGGRLSCCADLPFGRLNDPEALDGSPATRAT